MPKISVHNITTPLNWHKQNNPWPHLMTAALCSPHEGGPEHARVASETHVVWTLPSVAHTLRILQLRPLGQREKLKWCGQVIFQV